MNKDVLNELLVRTTEDNNRKVTKVDNLTDGSGFIINLTQRRMSTIETSVCAHIENGLLCVTEGDEIGYGSWYNLDEEALTEIQEFLNNKIGENAA